MARNDIYDYAEYVSLGERGTRELTVEERTEVVGLRLGKAMDCFIENPNGDAFRALLITMCAYQASKLKLLLSNPEE